MARARGVRKRWHDPQRHGRPHPAEAAVGVLRAFDVLDGMGLTPLGEWACDELRRVVPPPITPDMPARELLTQLAGADDHWNRAGFWFGGRTVEHIVAELAAAATDATPAERMAAIDVIDGLGPDAVAALRAAADDAPLAAHARDIAHRYELAPEPGVADMVWLATEYAHADLTRHGVAAARYTATDTLAAAGVDLDTGGVDRIAGSGHPHAGEVADTLRGVVGSPIPVQQLKIMLAPGCWRRVLVPENATLEVLHRVIIVVFGFDDDHLHVFTVGHRRYADPFHGLGDTLPEDTIRLHQALPRPKATISHEYDLGASWRHEILLEQTIDGHPGHLECVGGKGADPIEYYDPDDPEDPAPFDADAIDRRLGELSTTVS
ncbi:MAG TPA: plasmid pRiA4b ORF-3 family protein [Aldersonia sp.]